MINGYTLSRHYFNWAFEHPTQNNPTMTALYFFILEINNRLGWKKEFTITPRECLEAIGVSSYHTYKKNFDKLVAYGFVKIIKPSKNQYQANTIALVNNTNAPANALNNTLNNTRFDTHQNSSEQSKSTHQSSCDIPKTTNHKPQTNNIIKQNKLAADRKTKQASSHPARFVAPALSEVIDYYIAHENLSVLDAQYWGHRFFDFYSSNGWKVGRNKMVDWKATARNALKWNDNRSSNNRYTHPAANYKQPTSSTDKRF